MMGSNSVYIGDGVYAEYDGHGIWLKANGDSNDDDRIYLEPAVWNALLQFVDRLSKG